MLMAIKIVIPALETVNKIFTNSFMAHVSLQTSKCIVFSQNAYIVKLFGILII